MPRIEADHECLLSETVEQRLTAFDVGRGTGGDDEELACLGGVRIAEDRRGDIALPVPGMLARELSMRQFAALPHPVISSVPFSTDFVDQALARHGLTRRIELRAPFLSAVRILVASDMVSILRRRVGEERVRYRPLVIRPLPDESPTLKTAMVWPWWLDNQPAHRWLREMVGLVTKSLRCE